MKTGQKGDEKTMTVINTKMLFPTGISLNKTQTSFRIQSRKNVMINGKRKQIPAFATVKINYPLGASADLRTKFSEVQGEEQKFIEELNKKYGDGALNLESGTFTPNKSE